jgi:cell division protease FtsH
VNRTVKAVAFWIVVLIAGILMWKVVQSNDTSKMQELSFSEFMQDVDRGGVSQVTLAGNDVHGKLKNGNSAFHTKVPEAV